MKSVKKAKKNSKSKSAKHPIQQKPERFNNKYSSFSQHLIRDYAIPLTRLIEAKLVSLQHKVEAQ